MLRPVEMDSFFVIIWICVSMKGVRVYVIYGTGFHLMCNF